MRLSKEVRNIRWLESNYRKLPIEEKIALINILIDPESEEEVDSRLGHELRGFIFAASYAWESSLTVKKRKALKAFTEKYLPDMAKQTTHNC